MIDAPIDLVQTRDLTSLQRVIGGGVQRKKKIVTPAVCPS